MLKALDEEGLIQREGRFLRIPDWKKLAQSSDFDSRYLHLDRA